MANRDREKSRRKAYYHNNKKRFRGYDRNRKTRKREAEGTHTLAELTNLLRSQDGKCANPWCRVVLTETNQHVDHVVPLSRSGSNYINNLQFLCQPCNDGKGTLTMDEFLVSPRSARGTQG